MLPVSPNEPKERTTGATDLAQSVTERMFNEWCQLNGSDTGWGSDEVDDATRAIWVELGHVAIAEVEFDHVIVPAADVLKPYHVSVDIDDLRLVLGNQTVYSADDDDLHQAICRLEAIADGGAV